MLASASPDVIELGNRVLNNSSSLDAEREFERLRNLARHEQEMRASLSSQSQQAYQRGDGAAAHQLSVEAKQHLSRAEQYNKQASDYIFRQNNAPGRVAADTIDLHGQSVAEAEQILLQRIRFAQQHGQNHLHVIVGKGNHSANHVQKLKPCVEQACQQLGLPYSTEANAGRVYINLQGVDATLPHVNNQPAHPLGVPQPTQQNGAPQNIQTDNQPDEFERLAQKLASKIAKISDGCCVVM